MPLSVTVDGNSVVLERGSVFVELKIEQRSTAEFVVVDAAGTGSYQKGEPVIIADADATTIFGGVVYSVITAQMAPGHAGLYHAITCADYHYFADKRLVAESYEDKTCGFIVDDIFDKYLDAEGVTIGNIDLGATLVAEVFNYLRVTDCYDVLAEKAGFVWYIDENKALYFQERDTTAASWAATEANINNAELLGGNPMYRNRQYIRGGRGTTAQQTEVFVGNNWIKAFTVGFPFERVPTVTVEDRAPEAQTTGIKGIDTGYDCYWSKGDATLTFDTAPENTKDVTIVYYGQFNILTLVEDNVQIAAQLAIEGAGTGYVDDIADEPTLDDTDASIDSGEAKLIRFATTGQRLSFQTVETGLFPGQEQTITHAKLGLSSEAMLI